MDPLHRSSKDKSALPAGTPLDVSQPSDLVERAYRVVVEMLYESGVRGVADLKTAQIAKRLRSTESTLFRHIESREHLVLGTDEPYFGSKRVRQTGPRHEFDAGSC